MDKVREWIPLNFQLIGNPINWAIIILMVAIAGLGLALIFSQPASEE